VSRRRKAVAAESSSGPGTRALKWVGAITAVISLIVGVRQVTLWVGDALHRRREAATQVDLARQQSSRRAFADAWASLDRADALRPGEAVDSARIDVAFAWLQDARPGPGRAFGVITDAVTPSLDRALVNASGPRRADLLAHLGWAEFLRSRDGVQGDPAARYREALEADSGNVYANAMLGHWLMRSSSGIDAGRERFATALAGADGKRAFVRRLQLAALTNRGSDGDAELLRVADEMRQKGEALDPSTADHIFWVFTVRYGPHASAANAAQTGMAPSNLEATYDWIVTTSASAARYANVNAIRQRLRQ
jgi:hypothetical protein